MFESDPSTTLEVAPAAPHVLSARELLGRTDAVWTALGRAHIELLGLLAEADRREAWRDEGAEDVCHWVSIRYGISMWKAARWVEAGHSLPSLPLVSKALASGRLGIDHVVEPAGSQPPGPSNDSPPGRASVPPGRSDAGPTSSDVAAVTK